MEYDGGWICKTVGTLQEMILYHSAQLFPQGQKFLRIRNKYSGTFILEKRCQASTLLDVHNAPIFPRYIPNTKNRIGSWKLETGREREIWSASKRLHLGMWNRECGIEPK